MTDQEKRESARQFYYRWKNKGKEDEDARSYWIELLQDVLGVSDVTKRIEFEKKVKGSKGHTKRIDAFIPETQVLIEQKSLGIPLDKPQAGHDGKTPYEQAKEYDNFAIKDEKATWIITCNFAEIWIYNMNETLPTPIKLKLEDLQTKYQLLDFLVNKKKKKITDEMELSIQAGELVGKIHDRFLKQYNDPLAKHTQRSLNILCVRLVFCLYAEDAGLFGERDAFEKYISQYEPKDIRRALIDLFEVLDTPLDQREDLYLQDDLAAFPYVNGGLFKDEHIVIPKITDEIKDTLIESSLFNWADISPTIFGAVFESTLNPETRRAGGMHYTSVENIHKVIDPLFLDELQKELEEIKKIQVIATLKKRLDAYQEKLANLKFLDPACGSGNFLTETYLCLRRLENEVIKLKVSADKKLITGQISFGFEEGSPIKVSIDQFYGIEINDFAVSVAKTALWIAESQMIKETEDIVYTQIDFLPLKTNANIVEGNALRIDWNKIINRNELSYIIGNPPFVGARLMNATQKEEIIDIFSNMKNAGNIDYVSGWYMKATQFMFGTSIKCALVSTNSITQGEQVPLLWEQILNKGIIINFAFRTFRWDNEAKSKAHVHCVIIGFSYINYGSGKIYDEETCRIVGNINPYIIAGPNVLIKSSKQPICKVGNIVFGSMPNDGGYLCDYSDTDKEIIVKEYPSAEKFFKRFLGATEFLHSKIRWCLWLKDVLPSEINNIKPIMEAVVHVKEHRWNSNRESTKKLAETPTLFGEIRQPDSDYIIIPRHSSESRRYIPMGFVSPDIICGDANLLLPDATMYEFGVMMSNVHNAWMRTVCGRIKSDYRYSVNVVYNNFPWPAPTPEQKLLIEQTAQGILDARALYPDESLAVLYNPDIMPEKLRKAHDRNDVAVMRAYGMPIKTTSEEDCVAWLMRMYQNLVGK